MSRPMTTRHVGPILSVLFPASARTSLTASRKNQDRITFASVAREIILRLVLSLHFLTSALINPIDWIR